MLGDQAEVERFIVVLNSAQMNMLFKITMALLVLAIDPLKLILNGFHLCGSKPIRLNAKRSS